MQPTLGGHALVHSVSDCQRHTQIARGIHYSTDHAEYHHCSTSRRGDEPSTRFSSTSNTTTRTAWWSLCTLIFLISDKVHIYSGEGRKTAARFSSTSNTTTRTAWWSLCTLIFLISDKVHIYSGEGRKTAAQHVMMISINQPCLNINM